MNRKFTTDHEWLSVDGDVATVGITDYAQSQLGDLVFVELPEVGRSVRKGEAVAVVESVKAASDVYAPLTGEVSGSTSAVVAEPAPRQQRCRNRPRGCSRSASPARPSSTADGRSRLSALIG